MEICFFEAWELDVCLGCMLLEEVVLSWYFFLEWGLEKVSQKPKKDFDIRTMMAYSQVNDALPG